LFGGLPLWISLAVLGERPLSVLLAALASGLSLGTIDGLRFALGGASRNGHRAPPYWQSALMALGVALLFGLFGLLFIKLFPVDVFACVPLGWVLGFKSSRRQVSDDVQTVETLGFSGRGAFRGACGGLIVGLVFWLIFGLPSTRPGDPIFWLPFLPLGIMFGVLSSAVLEIKHVPNQGIRLSKRNALLTGGVYGLGGALIFGPFFWPVRGAMAILEFGLPFGMAIGVLASLWYGSLDVLYHYVLRVMLYFTENVPWRYAHFLDYAHRLILLDKVGGGYKFVDSRLMEYFSDLKS
jgi:hypothetical protein